MADCTFCQSTFEGSSPLKLSVQRLGDEFLLYAQNQGQNIIYIKRVLLCIENNGSKTILYIRDGGMYDFYIGGERLEQDLTHLKFRISAPGAEKARAEAEYIEIGGRSIDACTEL